MPELSLLQLLYLLCRNFILVFMLDPSLFLHCRCNWILSTRNHDVFLNFKDTIPKSNLSHLHAIKDGLRCCRHVIRQDVGPTYGLLHPLITLKSRLGDETVKL